MCDTFDPTPRVEVTVRFRNSDDGTQDSVDITEEGDVDTPPDARFSADEVAFLASLARQTRQFAQQNIADGTQESYYGATAA